MSCRKYRRRECRLSAIERMKEDLAAYRRLLEIHKASDNGRSFLMTHAKINNLEWLIGRTEQNLGNKP